MSMVKNVYDVVEHIICLYKNSISYQVCMYFTCVFRFDLGWKKPFLVLITVLFHM